MGELVLHFQKVYTPVELPFKFEGKRPNDDAEARVFPVGLNWSVSVLIHSNRDWMTARH